MSQAQHGCTKGKSCYSVASKLIDHLESGVYTKGFALGVFLDIEGAFDNLDYKSVIRNLEKRGHDPYFIEWFRYYMEHRLLTVKGENGDVTVHPVKGCCQGTVLSPFIWNNTFDDLIRVLEERA